MKTLLKLGLEMQRGVGFFLRKENGGLMKHGAQSILEKQKLSEELRKSCKRNLHLNRAGYLQVMLANF
ncbi:hypothetical protein BJN42_15585 [Pseudomonas koreensis]|nr:hypothetical protein BJN42_15585 [Pseudomonas koreensis]